MAKKNKLLLINILICVAILGFLSSKPLYVNAVNCTPNATKQCISNIVYWYDSCGALQNIYQNCNTANQICQNGQCVNAANPDTSHYVKSCYNNNLYWYSLQGTLQDLAQSCSDNNQCTADNCALNKCVNELKCDGSTCAKNSQDYINYCLGAQNQNNQNQTRGQTLVISMFGSKKSDAQGWQKNIDVANNDTINFLLIVKNNSGATIDNVSLKTDSANNFSHTKNLKINNLASTSNINSGIDLGAIGPKTSLVVYFTSQVQSQNSQNPLRITATVNSANMTQDSDYVMVNISNQTASSPVSLTGNSLINNLKKNWYIWLIIVAILIIVFIVIFRRLSSNL